MIVSSMSANNREQAIKGLTSFAMAAASYRESIGSAGQTLP